MTCRLDDMGMQIYTYQEDICLMMVHVLLELGKWVPVSVYRFISVTDSASGATLKLQGYYT